MWPRHVRQRRRVRVWTVMPGEAQLWISHLTRERQRHKHQERMNVQRTAGENHIRFSPREEALSTHEKMPQSNCLGGLASVQDGRSDKRRSLRPDMNKPRIIIGELRCGESLANRNPAGTGPSRRAGHPAVPSSRAAKLGHGTHVNKFEGPRRAAMTFGEP